jgi:hypothetical protein
MLNRGISQGYGPATSVIERRDISGFAFKICKKRCHCSECVKCSTEDFIIKALVLPLTAVKKKSYETGEKPRYLSSFAH